MMLQLKQICEKKGLSISELSRQSKISLRTIQDIIRRGDCRISTARVLCDTLDISLDLFYTKDEAGE